MNPENHSQVIVRQQGLTLVEVLVALMILAMMAGVSAEVISRAAEIRLMSQQRALGQLCADNLLIGWMLEASWPDLGEKRDQVRIGDWDCHWTLTVQGTPLPTMRRLDIDVYADKERGYLLTRVSGFVGQP